MHFRKVAGVSIVAADRLHGTAMLLCFVCEKPLGFCHFYNNLNWGECSEPHTCGENGKLSVYLYIYMVRAYSVYTSCSICA